MGGADKGLQPFRGVALAKHALRRLRPQVGPLMLSANRNLAAYAAFGVPVWTDAGPPPGAHAGPPAGLVAGLAHCETPLLAAVPCDAPLFPADLVARLTQALQHAAAEIAMAASPTPGGPPRAQPVFCLLSTALHDSLRDFLAGGGRRVEAWIARHRTAVVVFDRAGDDPLAFANANTLAELQQLAAG